MHRNVVAVVEAGAALGVAIEPRSFPEGTKTAADAAAAIGVHVGQIVKSLVFLIDGEPVMALVAGDNQLDERKLGVAHRSGRELRSHDLRIPPRSEETFPRKRSARTDVPIGVREAPVTGRPPVAFHPSTRSPMPSWRPRRSPPIPTHRSVPTR